MKPDGLVARVCYLCIRGFRPLPISLQNRQREEPLSVDSEEFRTVLYNKVSGHRYRMLTYCCRAVWYFVMMLTLQLRRHICV